MNREQNLALVQDFGNIRVLTLNVPAKLNAISPGLRLALSAALKEAAADPMIKALVLTGANGNFSAGADLTTFHEVDYASRRARMAQAQGVFRTLYGFPKPTVAAVEGVCYGAGLSMALCCDQIVVSDRAKLGAVFMKAVVYPDCGIIWTLSERVGLSKAKYLLGTAAVLTASEAVALGIADHISADGASLARAFEIAAEFASTAPLPYRMMKESLAVARVSGIEDVFELELEGQASAFASEDFREAVVAFSQKRPPTFVGR